MALVWRAGPAAAATRLVLSPWKQTSISNCSRSRPTRPRKSCIESGQHMTQLLSKLLATLLATTTVLNLGLSHAYNAEYY